MGVEEYRRFAWSEKVKCPGLYNYHNASVYLGAVSWLQRYSSSTLPSEVGKADLRWPKKCDGCDYLFEPDDEWQHNIERQYRRVDGIDPTVRWTLRAMPVGAMWDAWWMGNWKGADGLHLTV